ncbi:hypothetical protein MRX96_026910 [Rhipicephalus microplus]
MRRSNHGCSNAHSWSVLGALQRGFVPCRPPRGHRDYPPHSVTSFAMSSRAVYPRCRQEGGRAAAAAERDSGSLNGAPPPRCSCSSQCVDELRGTERNAAGTKKQ